MIGAPWVDAGEVLRYMGEQPGVHLREAYFTPTFSKHAGQLCRGVQLHIYDRAAYQPFAVGLRLFCALRTLYPEQTEVRSFLSNLLGGNEILQPDFDVEAYIAAEAAKVAAWQNMTRAYYLY